MTQLFSELLTKDKTVKVHHRNIRSLAIEMFKVMKKLSPDFMDEIFYIKTEHESVSSNTRSGTKFYNVNNPRTTRFGLETLSNLGPKIWSILPDSIKQCKSLKQFKLSIKKWIPNDCPCRLCRDYVPALGFIN